MVEEDVALQRNFRIFIFIFNKDISIEYIKYICCNLCFHFVFNSTEKYLILRLILKNELFDGYQDKGWRKIDVFYKFRNQI